jgi:hypothetical protein
LAQSVHHSSADFGYFKRIGQSEVKEGEFAGHMTGVIRKISSKAKGRPGFVGPLSAANGLKNRLKYHDDDAAGGQGAGRSIIR